MSSFGERIKEQVRRRLTSNPFLRRWPPGHFYSPVPELSTVLADHSRIFQRDVVKIAGIDSNDDRQLDLLMAFAKFHDDMPFTDVPEGGRRYGFDNSFFSYGDATILHCMLRQFRPNRVVEVGSGHSSAVMLDTNEIALEGAVALTFIEPYPDRLTQLLRDQDRERVTLRQEFVQHVPLDVFKQLEANDILFIDSSHVAKIGSDVVWLLTHVLPQLAPGVIVHIHDIFWPFEYPEAWLREGRAWNEAYFVKAFLQFNSAFQMLFFNSYVAQHHREDAEKHVPTFLRNPGGSLWLQRINDPSEATR
ncbi:MAG: class I SAM-dependent methyltransferase [Planctomycetota bacterium]